MNKNLEKQLINLETAFFYYYEQIIKTLLTQEEDDCVCLPVLEYME